MTAFNESKPRAVILRTRQLFQDALVRLSRKKRFEEISVQEVTEEATVNRANFLCALQGQVRPACVRNGNPAPRFPGAAMREV